MLYIFRIADILEVEAPHRRSMKRKAHMKRDLKGLAIALVAIILISSILLGIAHAAYVHKAVHPLIAAKRSLRAKMASSGSMMRVRKDTASYEGSTIDRLWRYSQKVGRSIDCMYE